MQPLIGYRLESKTVTNYLKVPEETKAKLEWVYGIRTVDCKRALQFTIGTKTKDSSILIDPSAAHE
jgi:hypothetical protein